MNNVQQPTFYFHDYESFGTHPAFDKPSQFAGVRTDSELNIIDEPLVIYCQQSLDYLPNPEAVLVTGITPQLANQKGVNEANFAKLIHEQFSQPNTCILGYNNIRFDDELSRHLFYRNFYDPYAYSWQNGNTRWDLIDLVRACYALRPEGINWPKNELDLPSFRLEHLTVNNHISHQNAHDAMADVYATIEIAKLIKAQQPKLFDYFFKLRNKNQVVSLFDFINMTPLVHVSGMFGANRGNTSIVAPISYHPTQNNAIIVCDLTGDVKALLSLSAEQIQEKLYTKTEDLEENESRIPIKLIHTNKCPIVAPINTLNQTAAKRLEINLDICAQNKELLKQNQLEIQQKLFTVFNMPSSFKPINDVDGQLYQGFFDQHDKSICELIRRTPSNDLDSLKIEPHDLRIKTLLLRYKARNYPNTLTKSEQIQWMDHCREKLNKETIKTYFTQLDDLAIIHHNNNKNMSLLKNLYHFCEHLMSVLW